MKQIRFDEDCYSGLSLHSFINRYSRYDADDYLMLFMYWQSGLATIMCMSQTSCVCFILLS
jgi:hypothetical protein